MGLHGLESRHLRGWAAVWGGVCFLDFSFARSRDGSFYLRVFCTSHPSHLTLRPPSATVKGPFDYPFDSTGPTWIVQTNPLFRSTGVVPLHHIIRHSHRFWGLGRGHFGETIIMPTTDAKSEEGNRAHTVAF